MLPNELLHFFRQLTKKDVWTTPTSFVFSMTTLDRGVRIEGSRRTHNVLVATSDDRVSRQSKDIRWHSIQSKHISWKSTYFWQKETVHGTKSSNGTGQVEGGVLSWEIGHHWWRWRKQRRCRVFISKQFRKTKKWTCRQIFSERYSHNEKFPIHHCNYLLNTPLPLPTTCRNRVPNKSQLLSW